ncbi:MAG TPA: ZIP family metal transporter [candidate division Zixibacteria bacterium]|nr:ZIP family metal transporter [candidate division Zixibacteria bacterium]
MDSIVAGSVASLTAGLATGLGALPALVMAGKPERALDAMLGFAAGVMVAAASFGLLLPSLRLGSVWAAGPGFLAGAAFLDLASLAFQRFHPAQGADGTSSRLRRVWLLVLAMVIHNIPEGLSVGMSFGQENQSAGTVMAIAIGLHNMPEGLAVALTIVREGYGRGRAVGSALLSGLTEPLVGIPSLVLVSGAQALLLSGLAFAAGAMLYVVFGEMIPESQSRGYRREATVGAVLGFLWMVLLDRLFA